MTEVDKLYYHKKGILTKELRFVRDSTNKYLVRWMIITTTSQKYYICPHDVFMSVKSLRALSAWKVSNLQVIAFKHISSDRLNSI